MKSKIGKIVIKGKRPDFFTFISFYFLFFGGTLFLSLWSKFLNCEISDILLLGLGFRPYAHSSVMKVDLLTAPVFQLTLELLIPGQAFPVGERQHRRVQEVCAAWHPGAGCLLQGSYCPGN